MTDNKQHKLKIPKLRFKEFSGEWEEKKLGDNINFLSGYPFKTFEISDNNLGIPILRGINIQEGFIRHNIEIDKYYIGDIGKLSKYILEYNDLVIGMDGSKVGKNSALILKNESGSLLIQRVARLRETKKSAIKFIFQIINSGIFVSYVDKVKTSSGIPHISSKQINDFLISFPQLPEQQKIADFLTAVDEKIVKIKDEKELLEKYKKGVMQKIFNQELRFKGENGEDFGEWEEKKIGELDLYISDGNYGEMYPKSSEMIDFGIPFIRANNITNLRLVWDDMKYISEDLHSVLKSGHLKTNDILITTRGDIGMLAHVTSDFNNSNINAQICLLRIINKSELLPKYFLYILSSRICQKQFKELETGSALKQLPKGNLDKVKIFLPPLPEQQKIADFLSGIDEKIEKVGEKLEKIEEFKKGLLQGMFV